MQLSRHQTEQGARWALDSQFLPPSFTLEFLLELARASIRPTLESLPLSGPAEIQSRP